MEFGGFVGGEGFEGDDAGAVDVEADQAFFGGPLVGSWVGWTDW